MTVQARISPSVPFTLVVEDASGKSSHSFKLAYDFDALGLIEDQLGKSMLTQANEVFDFPSCRNVSVLLWAALQENHPEYAGIEGLRLVRKNLTLLTAKDAKEACVKAFLKQLPDDQVERLSKAGAAPLEQSPEKKTDE